MDQHLKEGMTYIYQITQTQVVQVTVISASRISFPPDSRAHSSRELKVLKWRTLKCLESANDNRRKHLRSHWVKLHNHLNYLLGYNFFWKVNFSTWKKAFIFFCSQLNPVESHNTLSDYVYTKILTSKYHASLYILLLDKEINGNSRLPLIWDCSFVLLYYNEKMILYVTRYWAIKITSWLDT